MTDGYEIDSEIQTTGPRRLKHGLKWPQGFNPNDPWSPQTIFSQNVGVGVSKFWLPGKNYAKVGDGRV